MTEPAASVTAWPHEGIVPVELWDVLVDGQTLFARRDQATFYASLARVVREAQRGEAVRATGERLPTLLWDAVAIVGGALDEARARDAFDAARIVLDVVASDPFFAASHAFEALAELDAARLDAVVIDVGQTAIKASARRTRVRNERRAAPSPGAPGAAGAGDSEDGRAHFVDQIARSLVEACDGTAPSFVLLGLPCEVTERSGSVVLGSSTYPTEGAGDALVGEILFGAGYDAGTSVAIVNDAILAAWALARRTPSRARARLVLTLGFGVGAALVAPESPEA